MQRWQYPIYHLSVQTCAKVLNSDNLSVASYKQEMRISFAKKPQMNMKESH